MLSRGACVVHVWCTICDCWHGKDLVNNKRDDGNLIGA